MSLYMQNINDTLKKLANHVDFQKRYELMKQKIYQDPYVKAFLAENQGSITSDMLEKSLTKLYEYSTQSKECEECPSLEGCKNIMKGYHPHLVLTGSSIDINYDRCPRKRLYDKRKKEERLIQSIYVPKEIIHSSLGELDLDKGRLKAIKLAKDFVETYRPGEKQKGLYLYGPFGTGKTYLLGAIANELAKKQISSLIVYVPEFFREMKNSIGDQTVNEKLEIMKKTPILMLDDIGAETMSSWARDEILGTILQFRMMENLPTFFTSNFNTTELQHHLAHSQRGEEEQMKAARIMERIKYLSTPVKVDGPNRRV